MRQRRRAEHARRRELVVREPQRERRVQHDDAPCLEQLELREPVLDSVERAADVEPAERRVARTSSSRVRIRGSDDEASDASRRCVREAEVRFRRVRADDGEPHARDGAASTPALGRRGRERMVYRRKTRPLSGTRANLIRGVVAVLLGVEEAPLPARMPDVRDLGPRIPSLPGSPSDACMPVISLSPSFLPKPAGRGVDRRRGVAAFREPANRLVRRIGVVDPRVEHESGVERVPLSVQRVTRVLDERDEILRQEGALSKPACAWSPL